MRKLILSASSISAFKSCPVRFRNAYVYGIRPVEDKESQRIGTNWHTILEVASLMPGSECPECNKDFKGHQLGDLSCPICEGTNVVPEDIMVAVTRVLNKAYDGIECGDNTLEVERVTLLHALAGYRWHYGEQQESVVAREQYFSLPLLNPQTGHPVPDVFIKGRIDKLIEILTSHIAVKEHKSTSKSIDPDSTYWGHLNLDTQTTMYVYAARRMQLLPDSTSFAPYGPLISTVKYDVYHKPTIRPKKLTQGDSKKFVADGMYCGQKFEVVYDPTSDEDPSPYRVNMDRPEIEPGAKEGSFAIRETPDMFGARLLKDITKRPEFYFRCVELSRTDKELQAFEQELYDIAKNMQYMIRSGQFYTNEHQCEATFRCDYIGQCYNRETVDQDHIPDGFKCIFNRKDGE